MAEDRTAFRAEILKRAGAVAPSVVDELLAYNNKPFAPELAAQPPVFPLPDEPHVDAWRGYLRESDGSDVFTALKRHFIQLRFPIRAGISEEDGYRQATRKGLFESADAYAADAMRLSRPDLLQLVIHPTIAGHVPLLIVGDRGDFVRLVQAFSERNEPKPVLDSMGACIVKGLNNWSRIHVRRAEWEREHGGEGWAEEFQRLIPQKELYQDGFIILSRGPYSAIPARDVGMGESEWLDRSLAIRREHEITHYFTLRALRTIRNNVFDELIADFVGLIRAFGRYRADLAMRFLGLEAYPSFRPGGRLEVYRGKPPLSDEAWAVARTLAVQSARNLEAFAASETAQLESLAALAALTFTISTLTLEELASPAMADFVHERLA